MLPERLQQMSAGSTVCVVSDDQVGPLYSKDLRSTLEQAGYRVLYVELPAGEGTKTLQHASRLYDHLVAARADRKSTVVALGGGVIGDLAGFVAATFARGVRFVQVPTTLLAMVDASVGGKVAVDHPRAKNIIGAFHQPSLVICDLECLRSLPEREFRCGLAEVVKYGVILDAEFFSWLQQNIETIVPKSEAAIRHIVARSCQIKADVVEKDEFETTGLRAALNYGHTFAHAFETAAGYTRLKHGEAVAIGMICASTLAERLQMIGPEVTQQQIQLWEQLGLPTKVPTWLLNFPLVDLMRGDKKAVGANIRFVLPTRIGEVVLKEGVADSLVEQVIRDNAG